MVIAADDRSYPPCRLGRGIHSVYARASSEMGGQMGSDARNLAGVLDAERRRSEALVTRDFVALRQIVAPDIYHTHTRGVSNDFDSYFHFIENELSFLAGSRGELDVRLIGDVAVMQGQMRNLVLPKGRSEPLETTAQVLQVWQWRDGRWQMIAFQSTSLPG